MQQCIKCVCETFLKYSISHSDLQMISSISITDISNVHINDIDPPELELKETT